MQISGSSLNLLYFLSIGRTLNFPSSCPVRLLFYLHIEEAQSLKMTAFFTKENPVYLSSRCSNLGCSYVTTGLKMDLLSPLRLASLKVFV